MKRLHSCYVVLASCVLVGACNESTFDPQEPESIGVSGTLPSTPMFGQAVNPAVVVRDASGQPVPGVIVTFQVTEGGGSVSSATATTNGNGVATVPWTLGPEPGVNRLVAALPDVGSITFTVTTCGAFCIGIRYVGAVTAAQEAAFTNARLRWQEVISGDLPPVQLNVAAGACKDPDGNALVDHPAINEVIDDLLVYVQVDSIDGTGGVLGSAGPCFIRSTTSAAPHLPVFGIMRFDRADLAQMAQNGLLGDVILHELGHVLGFPILWDADYHDLLVGAGSNEPYYTGSHARSAFQLAGGSPINGVGVPVENIGGEGTRDSHWREAVMKTELMTGFVSPGSNPLSAITIGSLEDIGYQVDYSVADAYSVPPPSAQVAGGRNALRLEIVERPMPAPRVVH